MTEALHYGALLPALAAVLYRTRLPRGTVLVASAFAVSWAGDYAALWAGGAWYPSYLWLAAQFGFVAWAVLEYDRDRLMVVVALTLAVWLDAFLVSTSPDVLVTAIGSAIVVPAAIKTRHPFALALALYFGIGSALYLMMVAHVSDPVGFTPWWWAYQGARVAGWGTFLWTLWKHNHPHAGGRRAG